MEISAAVRTQESVKRLYETDMYEKWGNQPHQLRDYERRLIDAHCSDRTLGILNLGCGAGRESFSLHDRGYRDVTGLDCTPPFIDLARQKAQGMNQPPEFHLGSATELPFEAERFDVVTVFENVYGHITPRASRLAALREVRRCLKLGGITILVATSLADKFRCRVAFPVMEAIRWFRNPHRLEKGDKVMANARAVPGLPGECLARSHWFRPMEIDAEAAEVGLTVALASTVEGVLHDPTRSCRRLRRRGRLVYILKK